MLASMDLTLIKSRMAFREYTKAGTLENAQSLLGSLRKVAGIMQGWGKHYRFCNDTMYFERLDQHVETTLKAYFAVYLEEQEKADGPGRWLLLGIEALAKMEREPFLWPKKRHEAETALIHS